jgi:hypothetical protein
MGQQDWLTERFEENRPRLRGVADRMLGSLSEAEDAMQGDTQRPAGLKRVTPAARLALTVGMYRDEPGSRHLPDRSRGRRRTKAATHAHNCRRRDGTPAAARP